MRDKHTGSFILRPDDFHSVYIFKEIKLDKIKVK